MKLMRNFLDKQKHYFEKGGKLERFYYFYEAMDSFLYTSDNVTRGQCQVRDALDLKRMMITVVVALLPCFFFAMYNTGLQANLVLSKLNLTPAGWRTDLMLALGLNFDPSYFLNNVVYGALYLLPVYMVCFAVGGFWEALFSTIRRHDINEGFLVTGMLFPLILPPTIPLWQVAVGISFGVIIGKEIFGGTGKNFLNPALTARAFLFFAYPAQMSGDAVWIGVDGFSSATALSESATAGVQGISFSWWDAFLGFIPGSMGETSVVACLIGAFILIVTGIGSWKIMLSSTIGLVAMTYLFNFLGSETNPMFAVPAHWHVVIGGFAFGVIFMATDPVSAAMSGLGQYYYGLLIGVMIALIRVINPAFPEGVMLAILFANVFAPLIDFFVIRANIKRRMHRYGQ